MDHLFIVFNPIVRYPFLQSGQLLKKKSWESTSDQEKNHLSDWNKKKNKKKRVMTMMKWIIKSICLNFRLFSFLEKKDSQHLTKGRLGRLENKSLFWSVKYVSINTITTTTELWFKKMWTMLPKGLMFWLKGNRRDQRRSLNLIIHSGCHHSCNHK